MTFRTMLSTGLLVSGTLLASAGEKIIVSLRDFKDTELKYAGFETRRPVTVHIDALGGGGSHGWSYKSNTMFAYGWIINAETRALVWQMTAENTGKAGDDRSFDGTVALEPGKYEAYFTAYGFAFHSTFTHMTVNVDHRKSPLFGARGNNKRHFFSWLTDWWSDDIGDDWNKRSGSWGMDVALDESSARQISFFTPPLGAPDVVLAETKLGDDAFVRKGFTLDAPATLIVHSVGEGQQGAECLDCSWIIDTGTRQRVWETSWEKAKPAGGGKKNLQSETEVHLDKGTYTLFAITDDSHSMDDWNDAPPYDPMNWGVTVRIPDDEERAGFALAPPADKQSVIVQLTKIGDNESRSAGFTLKQDAPVQIYAFGERTNNRRELADYATIMNAKTRERVWTMDVDRTHHAGGASKNRYVDEVITLPKGSYLVNYVSDDSHSYQEWNDAAPFDKENYGITITAAGNWNVARVLDTYTEEKDKNIIAQIIRVGADADRTERFTLDRTTRLRIYALGEGQGREMFDYGWIEDARTGTAVWEMTYGMTFHAGGGRKNRMLNASIVLDKGEYLLRYQSDGSHSYGDWNVDPPDDRDYWGITVYRERASEPAAIPRAPRPPLLPRTRVEGTLP